MHEKAQKLKQTLSNELQLSSLVHRCLKQKTELNTHLTWMQCIETKLENSSYEPIIFLKIIKKEKLFHKKEILSHRRQQLTIGSFQQILIGLLSELELTEKRKRCIGNNYFFKLMYIPLLQNRF